MFCPNCGRENHDRVRFCASCGSDLRAATGVERPGRSRFKLALLSTAIPIAGLSILSSAFAVGTYGIGTSESVPMFILWGVAAGLLVAALLAGAGFAFARRHEIASGIVAGVGISIVALALTCFANLRGL